MSSATAGSRADSSAERNHATVSGQRCPTCGQPGDCHATSAVAAEAEQGEGPAAASATSSAAGEGVARTSAVSVSVGFGYAAAACDFAVVVVGPDSAAAASQIGVCSVGPDGAAASCNAANGSTAQAGGNPGRDARPATGATRTRSRKPRGGSE